MSKLSYYAILLQYTVTSLLLPVLSNFVKKPYVSESSLRHPAYFWVLRYQLSHLAQTKEACSLMIRVVVNTKKLVVYDT